MRELDGDGLEGYIAHIGAEGFFTPEGKLAVIAEARPPYLLGDIEYMQNRPVLHDVYAKGAVRLISVPVYAFGGEMESLNFYRLVCSSLMRKLYNTSSAYSRALLYPAWPRICRRIPWMAKCI